MRRVIVIITQTSFFRSIHFDGNDSAYRGGETDRQGYPDCQVNEAGICGNGSEPAAENSSQS